MDGSSIIRVHCYYRYDGSSKESNVSMSLIIIV